MLKSPFLTPSTKRQNNRQQTLMANSTKYSKVNSNNSPGKYSDNNSNISNSYHHMNRNIQTRKISTISNPGSCSHRVSSPLPNGTSTDFSTNRYCFALGMTYRACGNIKQNTSVKHQHQLSKKKQSTESSAEKQHSCDSIENFHGQQQHRHHHHHQRLNVIYRPFRLLAAKMTSSVASPPSSPKVSSKAATVRSVIGSCSSKDVVGPYFYPSSRDFSVALEVMNRRAVKRISKENKGLEDVWYCDYLWEYKGHVTAGQQFCIICRDIGKPRNMLEKYYMDTVELKQERSILCHGCMGRMLKENVGNDIQKLRLELNNLRKKHSIGSAEIHNES